MDIDAELMFECLIYLNVFYFPLFATCETIMIFAKFHNDNPYIRQDAAIVFSRLACELTKILIYQRFKEEKKQLVTGIAVFFTCITTAGLLYTFTLYGDTKRFIKLEYILNTLTIMLVLTELAFGATQLFVKCFRKNQYY